GTEAALNLVDAEPGGHIRRRLDAEILRRGLQALRLHLTELALSPGAERRDARLARPRQGVLAEGERVLGLELADLLRGRALQQRALVFVGRSLGGGDPRFLGLDLLRRRRERIVGEPLGRRL